MIDIQPLTKSVELSDSQFASVNAALSGLSGTLTAWNKDVAILGQFSAERLDPAANAIKISYECNDYTASREFDVTAYCVGSRWMMVGFSKLVRQTVSRLVDEVEWQVGVEDSTLCRLDRRYWDERVKELSGDIVRVGRQGGGLIFGVMSQMRDHDLVKQEIFKRLPEGDFSYIGQFELRFSNIRIALVVDDPERMRGCRADAIVSFRRSSPWGEMDG